ncbi:MAG: hypothetical protein KAR05_00240 [Candidatus Omnitrophica bacterium]|nr:hypothetical protein [Candidatus Omnitrophota bacterium]
MKRFSNIMVVLLFFLAMASVLSAGEKGDSVPTNGAIQEVIKANLAEKTKFSGTLDLYDAGNDVVRNLRMIGFLNEVKNVGDLYFERINYRDVNSGDVVTVDVTLKEVDGKLDVTDYTIFKVERIKKEAVAEKKEFSDEEIHEAMREYIKAQARFTGSFDLFDEKKEGLRHLQFLEFKGAVRRYGILHISTAEFADKDAGEILDIDISAENQEGDLKVTKVKVMKVKKAPTEQ